MGVRVLSIGECMIELFKTSLGSYAIQYGGDTFNTAVYLAREGVKTGYATALGGDDPFSGAIVSLAQVEGLSTDAVLRVPERLPGLYAIETDSAGERRFFYWRQNAPARQLFELEESSRIEAAMEAAEWIYFSGITLGIYSDAGLERFEAALKRARQAGTKIAFDSNYRPALWAGDIERARSVFRRFLPLATLLLPSCDDERLLWELDTDDDVMAALQDFGAEEIVLKRGDAGVLVRHDGGEVEVPIGDKVVPVDTTAAGDSFNAAYLAARLQGTEPEVAVARGQALARRVIMVRGALIPREEA
ncbi:sugar kinase [Afifella aestuarii]|uniref:sugar kinase n=1 Tax=Afifella aestuarii TaxID=1909496 RepID=UPI000FE30065|nr:sugar kinase [Afifella aestuarii]